VGGMSHAPSFQFYPKQWLGDDTVMLMDWDARGMHVHLLCIAWQQDPPCTLPNDDTTLRKWCGHPQRWKKVRPQVLRAWKLVDGRFVQEGLLREWEKQRQYSESRRVAAEARWGKKDAYALRTQSVRNALQSSSSLSSLSFLKKEKKEKKDVSLAITQSFEEFWNAYPPRNGKRLGEADAKKRWNRLSAEDRTLVRLAVQHYATSERVRDGIGIRDPHRWLRSGKDDEPWRDWIEPEQPASKTRLNGAPHTCTKRLQGPDDRFARPCGQPASPHGKPTEPRCHDHLAASSKAVTHAD
jgi:uncharacterized protein YdaU (DUF1376 family)